MDRMTADVSSDEDDPYTNFVGRLKGNIFLIYDDTWLWKSNMWNIKS